MRLYYALNRRLRSSTHLSSPDSLRITHGQHIRCRLYHNFSLSIMAQITTVSMESAMERFRQYQISKFFSENGRPSQQQCNEEAERITGVSPKPTLVQGSRSYTVIPTTTLSSFERTVALWTWSSSVAFKKSTLASYQRLVTQGN